MPLLHQELAMLNLSARLHADFLRFFDRADKLSITPRSNVLTDSDESNTRATSGSSWTVSFLPAWRSSASSPKPMNFVLLKSTSSGSS